MGWTELTSWDQLTALPEKLLNGGSSSSGSWWIWPFAIRSSWWRNLRITSLQQSQQGGGKGTSKNSEKNIAHQLIGDIWGTGKRESVGEHQTRGLLHWPAEMDKKRTTCKQCAKNRIRRKRIGGCEQRGVNLWVSCFKPYHKEKHPELFN